MPEFVAQTLNSQQLLALLYICESKRKGSALSVDTLKKGRPQDWEEMIATFSERFANLEEQLRFEVLEAHLMSVEDLDVYHNETLQALLDENRVLLDFLTDDLKQDPRFQV